MYLSVRRSKHALLAIGFFALFVVIFFSTLLSVNFFNRLSIQHLIFPLCGGADILPREVLGIAPWTHSSTLTAIQLNLRYVKIFVKIKIPPPIIMIALLSVHPRSGLVSRPLCQKRKESAALT